MRVLCERKGHSQISLTSASQLQLCQGSVSEGFARTWFAAVQRERNIQPVRRARRIHYVAYFINGRISDNPSRVPAPTLNMRAAALRDAIAALCREDTYTYLRRVGDMLPLLESGYMRKKPLR